MKNNSFNEYFSKNLNYSSNGYLFFTRFNFAKYSVYLIVYDESVSLNINLYIYLKW